MSKISPDGMYKTRKEEDEDFPECKLFFTPSVYGNFLDKFEQEVSQLRSFVNNQKNGQTFPNASQEMVDDCSETPLPIIQQFNVARDKLREMFNPCSCNYSWYFEDIFNFLKFLEGFEEYKKTTDPIGDNSWPIKIVLGSIEQDFRKITGISENYLHLMVHILEDYELTRHIAGHIIWNAELTEKGRYILE